MTASPGGSRLSVVLADDSPELRLVVSRTLESSGLFEVVGQAGDGDEAFRLVLERQPALLLIDVSMPAVDGLEALPSITAVCPETAVVVFTGFEDEGLAAAARELGAVDVVEKSISLEELPLRLLGVLEESSPGAEATTSPVGLLSVARGGGSAPAPGQAVLDEQLLQFRQLFERAAIGMATLTSRGTIVRANRAMADLMSCAPTDLVGVDYGRVTVGEGERLDRALEAIVATGDDLVTFEHRIPAAPQDEERRVARVTLAPIRDSKQRVLYVFAQVQDISAERAAEEELRRSEERFRLLVSAVSDYAIFMLDTDGTVISWNAGAQRIKGYSAQEIVGRSFRVFYPPQEQEAGRPEHNLRTALERGRLVEEGWRVRKDGSRFWASVLISPVFDDTGRHIGFAKVTRDQTAQREHEEDRQDLIAQQADLLAVTAHELRTPMAVIQGSVDILRSSWQDIPTEERQELMAGLHSSAQRLRRLVADMSTASRLQGRTFDLLLERVSLGEVLRQATARTRALHPRARINCEVRCEADIDADESRLGQALDNLLDNAVRHGVAPVTLRARAMRGSVDITVSDTGPGVGSDLVPHLFERSARGARSQGAGLGLFLVREIVRAHNGQIAYRPPARGRTTTFEITLPLRQQAAGHPS